MGGDGALGGAAVVRGAVPDAGPPGEALGGDTAVAPVCGGGEGGGGEGGGVVEGGVWEGAGERERG